MDTKDWIGIVLTAWANLIATITLIHTIRKDSNKKATHRKKPDKQKRK